MFRRINKGHNIIIGCISANYLNNCKNFKLFIIRNKYCKILNISVDLKSFFITSIDVVSLYI